MKKIWKDDRGLRENLQKRLPKMTSKYFKEGRHAMKPGVSWEDMHQFRLHTKRFRYTLELFRQFYGPGLEQRIETLRKVQTYLGDINDAIVTSEMLVTVDHNNSLRNELSDRADSKIKKLREYWSETFDADGVEEKWIRYLIQFACRTPAKSNTAQAAPPASSRRTGS